MSTEGLDDIDLQIVKSLLRDGRMRSRAIASECGISESTAHNRINRLIDKGVIKGFRADVDLAVLGRPMLANILIRFTQNARNRMLHSAKIIAKQPGVEEVLFLAGSYDLSVKLACEDSNALRDFVVRLSAHPEIASTETSVVMERIVGEIVD
ncbi:MAG: Lrp/AsnC family transcriptional regulator [Propionibacteriaceae bacterium]|jgi:DNA-binding Lrp family transcriptional regulator|nr:Lrp/AsnC family transcriptional regulator [Propionibacteriaceae bacterium]